MSNRPNSRHRAARSTRPTAAPPRPFWQSPWLWVGLLGVIALAVAVALSVGSDDTEPIEGETGFAEIIGDPLVPYVQPDPAVGAPVPDISAVELATGERTRVGGDGVPRIYGFFAHWCPVCQAELPSLVDWLDAGGLPAGTDLVAISTAVDPSRGNYPPSAWFEREGFDDDVLLDGDDSALAAGFGLSAYPFWVAVDAEGLVVERISGELTPADLDALVATVSDGAGSGS